jgi:enoyl-CoA hydratase
MYHTLLTEISEGICTITINRPDKLNAINKDVMQELSEVMEEVKNNAEIRLAILTGSGAKAFVAGADISEFTGLSGDDGMALAKKGQDVFFAIENSTKPVIAAVNGFALGGGCELAMACHFRIASENAKFGQPEVNLGLIPGYGGTQRLVHLIGKGRALELLMTGNMIDAKTAHQYGLVNHVVPQDELLTKARELAHTIISKAPLAIGFCIEAANAAYTAEGYQKELDGFGRCFETADMKEGATAFLEKRKPVFTGR